MSFRDLLVLYALVGVACALAVLRREKDAPQAAWAKVASAAATVVIWPLWGPFVLAAPRPREPERAASTAPVGPGSAVTAAMARIQRALDASVTAVAGTPMSQVFSRQVAQRIGDEVALVAQRQGELAALASAEGLDRQAAEARLAALEALHGSDAASERTLATARLQVETLARLESLRAADAQALDELADLLEALRAQLLLARYAGSSADGTGAIVSEVWARLEGLGAGLEPAPGGGAA